MTHLLFILFLGMTAFVPFQIFGQETQKAETPHPTRDLKNQMRSIASALAEIESLKSADPIPWDQVKSKTKSIQKNLLSVKKSQVNASAQAYLGRLTSMVAELEILESKKDTKMFDRIPSMTQTCYQCHKAQGVLGITEIKH